MNTFISTNNDSLEELLSVTGDCICVSDQNMNFLSANQNFADFYGLKAEDLIGKNAFEVYPEWGKSVFYDGYREALNGGVNVTRVGYSNNLKTWVVSRFFVYKENQCIAIAHKLNDITHKNDFIGKLDQLTSLSNRFGAEEDLTKIKNYTKNLFLCLFDINNFKHINDKFGNGGGDKCLMEVAARIKKSIGAKDNLYRLGDDRFLLLSLENYSDCLKTINNIKNEFEEYFVINNQKYLLGFTMGVYSNESIKTNEKTEDYLNKCEVALSKAKKLKLDYVEYNSNDVVESFDPVLYKEIKDAIKNNELEIYYQPQADTLTSSVLGVETLIRWNHPERGLVSPINFIPFCEKTGLIKEIDRWVIKNSFKKQKEFSEIGFNMHFAINLSSISISDNHTVGYINEQKEIFKIEPGKFCFEITETSLITDSKNSEENIKQIKKMGFLIALDDFGSGYSSINYLVKYPSEFLKIDMEYIKNINSSENDRIIVKNIINLARGLRITVVAEGVENKEQLETLKKMKCEIIQGYYFSKPLNEKDLMDFLKKNKIENFVIEMF